MLFRKAAVTLLSGLLLVGIVESSAIQKPVITKRFHSASRAAASVAASVDELWKQSDIVIEGVVEMSRPANHMSKDDELAFTMYTVRVTEFFKGSTSDQQVQQVQRVLVRRRGGRVEKPNAIEIHEPENDLALKTGDRVVAFLRRAQFTLPAFANEPFYIGTSFDGPDSFIVVEGNTPATRGNSPAARELIALDAGSLRERLRRKGGR